MRRAGGAIPAAVRVDSSCLRSAMAGSGVAACTVCIASGFVDSTTLSAIVAGDAKLDHVGVMRNSITSGSPMKRSATNARN